jgi:serine protease AprX
MSRNIRELTSESDSAAWGRKRVTAASAKCGMRMLSKSACWGRRVIALLGCLLFALPVLAEKLAKDLPNSEDNTFQDVIVQYRVRPTAAHFDRIKAKGGQLNKDLRGAINGAAFHVPVSALKHLSDDPDVLYVSPDRMLYATAGTPDYYDDAVNASYGWNLGLDGTGVGIAFIDSGIAYSRDFTRIGSPKSRIVYQRSYVPGQNELDQNGHGTHVAGIATGNGYNSSGSAATKTFKGIAPNANLIILRVLDQNGAGTDSAVISAIQDAINLKGTYNIRVLNLSVGRPAYESYTLDPLCQAVEAAWKAGITVVVAAGNEGRNDSFGTSGYGTITAPGNDPYVITVGAMKAMGTATRSDDQIASYSSKGPTLYDHVVKPDIVAPGNRAISALASTTATLPLAAPSDVVPLSVYSSSGGTAYAYLWLSGTSMATPVVSGAAALLFQQNPALTPDQVKARLMKTAYKVFPASSSATDPVTGIIYISQYDIFTVGAGYLDIQAALQNTDLAPPVIGSAISPTAAVDASGNVYLVNNPSLIWDNSIVWGNSLVWGTSVVWGTTVIGDSVVWGDSLVWGNSVVWGDSSLNGYSVVWGTSTVWGSPDQTSMESTSIALNGEN